MLLEDALAAVEREAALLFGRVADGTTSSFLGCFALGRARAATLPCLDRVVVEAALSAAPDSSVDEAEAVVPGCCCCCGGGSFSTACLPFRRDRRSLLVALFALVASAGGGEGSDSDSLGPNSSSETGAASAAPPEAAPLPPAGLVLTARASLRAGPVCTFEGDASPGRVAVAICAAERL